MKLQHILFALILISGCTPHEVTENGTIDAYFCPRDDCLGKIMSIINSSDDIKCAFYDLDIPQLIYLLGEKKAHVIIEDSNALPEFKTGKSYALMHNKFCVLDNTTVITGSMNPTERGNFYNNNNLVVISSPSIAKNYMEEFDELANGIYGMGTKTKKTSVMLSGTEVENYFCPEDNCKLRVINALKAAEKSIYFMTYSFTDEDIGNLLWNKQYLGVDVRGILEKRQLGKYSRYEDLENFSIIDKNPYTMHHKVFIIDNKTVITGSYNPTKNANENNDENILIIHSPDVAQSFLYEFNNLWEIDYTSYSMSNIEIYEVNYNPEGADERKEYVILHNKGEKLVDLGYYFLSDNSMNSRLSGLIAPGEKIKFRPTFSLTNKGDVLILKHNLKPVDIISWNSSTLEEGQVLIRQDGSWKIK